MLMYSIYQGFDIGVSIFTPSHFLGVFDHWNHSSTLPGFQTTNRHGLLRLPEWVPIQVCRSLPDLCHRNQWFALLLFVFIFLLKSIWQYLNINLGMSRSFGPVDLAHLPFPAHMRVDYVRIYQPANAINVGCDPKDFPTRAYISKFVERFPILDMLIFLP